MSAQNTPSGIYTIVPHENGEYRCFIPNPLPPHLIYDDELMKLAMEAQRYLSELGTRSKQVPNVSLFINAFMQKEAEFSCQIEGTKASIRDAMEQDAGIENKQADRQDIVNYLNALQSGVKILEHTNINLWFIRNIHEQLMAHQPEKKPGSFREAQNQIGGIPYSPSTADFVPPPVLQMKECLDSLDGFIQHFGDNAPLIRVALVHAQFETIHPFMDGNGRVGRLLITFQLYKEKILDKPVLYLSYYFKKNKEAYNAHLQAVRDNGAWESWLKFFFRGVIESCQSALDLAANIIRLKENYEQRLEQEYGLGKADSPKFLLAHLFTKPIVSGDDVIKIMGRAKSYCYGVINDFEKIGILVEYTGNQRYKRYAFKEYLDLLESVKS